MSSALLAAWSKTLRRHGAAQAVVQAADGRTATFREIDAGARAWRAACVPPGADVRGRRVLFAVSNGIEWFEIFLGLLQAGAVAVPLDPGEPPAAREALALALGAAWLWDGAALQPRPGRRRHVDPRVCLLKLTSGSTGAPRPLAFSDGQLLADGRQIRATMKFGPRDSNYALIPFGHSYGLGNLVIPLIAAGVPIVTGSAPLPHAIAADFKRWQPTVFPGVPVMWRALTAAAVTLPGLRLAISAGAPLAPATAAEFFAQNGQRIHGFYGSSETGGIAYDPTGRAALAGGVGRAMKGVRLTVGRGGRLGVSSAAVLTAGNPRRRGKLGLWLMPDRARVDGRGNVTLLGRRGSTVKISGRRVTLAEIESIFRQVEGVRDVWIGVRETPEVQLGAAVVSTQTVAEVRTELQTRLAAWKIPKRIVVLASLPHTGRGKIDSQALQALVFGESKPTRAG
ncbi:MAG TPA: class I adenylate-forming enzyme family protein [Candidatus Didemnitutus sp.]|nr:class I adenylate-forming enzyme family protein [Candidatus Didemnitutus sp.]